jgi:hypothetical protein
MGLIDRLLAFGESLGIVCADPSERQEVVKITTRTVTMVELRAQIQEGQSQRMASLPPELSLEFDKIFQADGLKPLGAPWTIEHLAEMLESPPLKGRDRASVQRALLEAIKAAGFSVEDVIKDAIARDHAIHGFSLFCRAKLDERAEARQREKADLVEQIRQLQQQSDALDAETSQAAEQWKQWCARKLAFEERMAWATGFLLDRPVVTVDKAEPETDRKM